jgi:tagatose 1,6-diphosphate aldolase
LIPVSGSSAAGLAAIADPSGIVCGLAFDHRDSLDAILAELGLTLSHEEICGLKKVVVRELAPLASAVMLDHDYGRLAIEGGAVPASVGLIMPLEAQGYAQHGDDRRTTLMSDFGPADARSRGAVACKLLVPFRPDRPGLVDRQLALAAEAVAATHAAGLSMVLEPQIYRLSTESAEVLATRLLPLTLTATEHLAALGADLLKLPFPIADSPDVPGADDRAREACPALDHATGGTPWVLYGAGVEPETFAWQLRHAGAAGASGFLVGRTVWRDALTADLGAAARIAATMCLPRFAEYVAIARKTCRPLASTAKAPSKATAERTTRSAG